MIWLSFEICQKIVIVTLQLILHLFLLVPQALYTHSLNVLLELSFSYGLHQSLFKSQSAKCLFPSFVGFLVHPLRNGLVLRCFSSWCGLFN